MGARRQTSESVMTAVSRLPCRGSGGDGIRFIRNSDQGCPTVRDSDLPVPKVIGVERLVCRASAIAGPGV
jgi:hypothetical protein